MAETVVIAPPNALLFISHECGGDVPEFVEDRLVLFTDTRVSIGCLPDMDGETEITLGSVADVSSEGSLVFDGTIKTPTKKIVVSTVEDEEIIAAAVPSLETRIRIWANRTREPDKIVIGWG